MIPRSSVMRRFAPRLLLVTGLVLAAGLTFMPRPAHAYFFPTPVFVCPTFTNHGNRFSTIQAAINHSSNPEIIYIFSGTYYEHLHIDGLNGESSTNVQLVGLGNVTVDGDGDGIVLSIGSYGNTGYTVSLLNIEITGGYSASGSYGAGGIWNYGNLTLKSGTDVTDNDGDWGGGVSNSGTTSSLTMTGNSEIEGNTAYTNGGGIFNQGTVTMRNSSEVINNLADNNGGGILNGSGTVTLDDSSTIYDNQADTDGGGIYNDATVSLYSPSAVYANNPDNCVNC